MPVWLLLTVMALAVYRATRLLTRDTFPPVLWLRDRVVGGWRPLTSEEIRRTTVYASVHANDPGPWPPELSMGQTMEIEGKQSRYLIRAPWSPYWLAELMSCPWCASGWIAGAVTLATDLSVGLPDPWLAGPAVWGAAALLASRSWS